MSGGYFACMVVRSSVAFAIGAMKDDPVLALTDTDVGSVVSLGNAAVVVGKVIGGPVIDTLGGDITLASALTAMAGVLVGTTYASSAQAITVGRFALMLLWSVCFPSCIQMGSRWFPGEPVTATVAMASRMGSTAGNAFTGLLLDEYLAGSWAQLFTLLAGFLSTVMLVWCATWQTMPSSPKTAPGDKDTTPGGKGALGIAAADKKKGYLSAEEQPMSTTPFLRTALSEPRLWLCYGFAALNTGASRLPNLPGPSFGLP